MIMDILSFVTARLKRTGFTALMVGVMAVSLAACDQGAASQTVSTPQIVEVATSTPAGAQVATPEGSGAATAATAVPEITAAAETTPVAEATASADGSVQAAPCTLLNLNDVTQDALMATIPGFSSRMVREFLEYRPYVSIQQFRREIGKYVDASQVAEYEKYVYVPVDPNESDEATLMQIPGVDATVAAELAHARPYASNVGFLQALTTYLTPEQLNVAACYLVSN
jgi:radical SAM superfamily enzyme with C-terminal helix-hairpin-helix motif